MRLTAFDPRIVAEYHITESDLRNVVQYLTIVQDRDSRTLADLRRGGYYGTSILLHELIQLRYLLERDPQVLRRDKAFLRRRLTADLEAHLQGLVAEYEYLQGAIRKVFGQIVGIGALVQANASTTDFDLLFASDVEIPIFPATDNEIEHARGLLERLRALGEERMV
jgi:hypothetical protein